MFSVVSWNVNSIGARINAVSELIPTTSPDIILLQEVKCISDAFPYSAQCFEHYNINVHGQKGYNGVAILSKQRQEEVIFGIPGFEHEFAAEARYVESLISLNSIPVRVISVYVPNGSEVNSEKFLFKLDFFNALKGRLSYLLSQGENLLVCGDMNVALDDLDVHDPSYMKDQLCFSIEERKALRSILNLGLYDSFRILNPHLKKFTWWDYRKNSFQYDRGLRIDYILVSSHLCDMINKCYIEATVRGWERPSDHAPLFCEFN
ncbi:Exodeoxyribonuclease III [Candidatus Cyrtobacter comes]|uniref:Exodeoxyribonuclease III n=1 Tax=Candidatus Cyrtobacter comes TaxID=675776 RepID=A0ABU5L8H8_9RICK|nr:exodeoxyribonuclease III [Candidatus Cyrtobacter comes]MDZ5762419.1 Exodeoxyribonuclease III [Candidatus Cyrtobacter comes]